MGFFWYFGQLGVGCDSVQKGYDIRIQQVKK
jgi:hypothetical protein